MTYFLVKGGKSLNGSIITEKCYSKKNQNLLLFLSPQCLLSLSPNPKTVSEDTLSAVQAGQIIQSSDWSHPKCIHVFFFGKNLYQLF